MMETQEDSIDIARLQRVALGLESATSQPDSNGPALVETIVNYDEQPGQLQPNQNPLISDTKRVSHRIQRKNLKEWERNATDLLNINQLPPERIAAAPPVLQATKMASADALPSDTQVISQSVYDEILRQNKEAGNNEAEGNLGDRGTLMTLHEGDSGHIDLLSGFDGASVHAANTDENEEHHSSKLGDSSPLVYEPNLFPESQRFVAKTPATVTKQGQVEAIATVSPLVSRNPLASDLDPGSGIMALSQVFRATQAPSSPLVNGLQSDLLSDKPSPNIPIQSRLLAPALSSPYNTLAATFPRDSSESQLNYVTMKESQANRESMAGERMTRSADHIYSENQSDGEFEKEPSFIARMRRQKKINEEATAQFAVLGAPARPSSRHKRQADSSITSLPGNSEQGDLTSPSKPIVIEDESQIEGASEFNRGQTSEEETEQEEDLQPPCQPQELNSSTEENKENCHDLSTASFSHAASAHDRLSQALSLHESPHSKSSMEMLSIPRSPPRNRDDEPVDAIGSSPIMVVKDSQRSPGRGDDAYSEINNASDALNKPQTYHTGSQLQGKSSANSKNGTPSPAKQVRIQSSPPASQYDGPSFLPSNNGAPSQAGSCSASPSGPQSQPARGPSEHQINVLQSSHSAIESQIGKGTKAPTVDSRDKSSSMPSRVSETPVHQRPRQFGEVAQMTTIPETSPNHFQTQGWLSDTNNEAADQDDDDLPPIYSRAQERATQSQPIITDSSSPIKPLLNSKILSSPSGRQRRALTEIAADASPQVGGGIFDVDINILSAEDQEFRSAIAMSPIPPRKKRRGNDGQQIYASDPILPVTPRPTARLAPLREVEETAPGAEAQPKEQATKPNTTLKGQPKPPRRPESIWDVEDSPKFRVSKKERSKILARSLEPKRRQPTPPPLQQAEPPKQGHQVTSLIVEEPKQASPVPVEPRSDAPTLEENPGDGNQPVAENLRIACNQIFAPWSGSKRAYYPATCFGRPFGTSQTRYLVKFEDSAPVEVPEGGVKRLELRVGDAVKVDMPNVPKVTHIIRGFTDKLSEDDLSREISKGIIPVTDVYGYSTLILGPKQRKSLPNTSIIDPENGINVAVSRIYLDTILWNQLKDRSFTYNSGPAPSDRLQTPSDRYSTPTSPGTRISRSFRFSRGLFSGMIFAVSYGENNEAKSRITKMILENDGRILEDGFNELFEVSLNAPLATPGKSPSREAAETNRHLRLGSGVEDMGFACLIADRHSRRPKYMQALALNLPCLSDRWVEDCVVKAQVLDWEMYLLPAGESSYLNGATKSRILTPYPATKARLAETVASRPNLLNGQSVLLITARNGKADEERRKAYLFLTYALGASKIERVPDIQSARAVLNEARAEDTPSWDWIYIDDDEKASKAGALAVSSSQALTSKKRRKSKLMESIGGNDLGLNTDIRIVGNEFVCQSLILGRLVDQ